MNATGKSNYNHLQDAAITNLYNEIFPYFKIPKVDFNKRQIPMDLPEDIWITDTTFRDGQQSTSPYTTEQIIKIFDYLHELDNNSGIIRQTEFFLYTEKDRKAAEVCLERGYEFPEVTSWIRANKEDLELVKEMGIKETGILMSCSDYHIFNKLNKTREETMDMYLSIVAEALNDGIYPRCHLEDITMADFYGFVLPLVDKLMGFSKETNIPVKIRVCDTLGLGVPYNGASVPRSVQGLINGLRHYCNVPSEMLEWHGHNAFYAAVSNATTAWLYGASAINTSLLGIGERTGICPLEAMLIEYAQLKGTIKNLRMEVITEITEYFQREINYQVPDSTPFLGNQFNVTKTDFDLKLYNNYSIATV